MNQCLVNLLNCVSIRNICHDTCWIRCRWMPSSVQQAFGLRISLHRLTRPHSSIERNAWQFCESMLIWIGADENWCIVARCMASVGHLQEKIHFQENSLGMSIIPQNSMVNQPQGHNSMDSSAALLQQQQHNFDVQVSLVTIIWEIKMVSKNKTLQDISAQNGPPLARWSNKQK